MSIDHHNIPYVPYVFRKLVWLKAVRLPLNRCRSLTRRTTGELLSAWNSDIFSVFSAYCFTICHPTCGSVNRNTFSRRNLTSAGLTNVIWTADTILREPCSVYWCYGPAYVPKWPQKQSQSFGFLKISWWSLPPDPLSVASLYVHTYQTPM